MELMSADRFGKKIYDLLMSRRILRDKNTWENMLSDEMTINLDMLGTLVETWVVGNM